MTDEKQAIRTLADNLVKAMKTVSANTPVRRSVSGVSGSGGGGSGSGISSISASKVTGLPNVFKTLSIDMAQIKRSSTQTAFIHESVQGKVYIDDLAVSDASIVNLAAGTVLINDSSGNLVELYVDATTGDVSTRAVSYNGSNIINQNSLNGNRIVNNSITTTQLNASEIFAAQGTIMNLIADNIDANTIHVVAANIDGTLTASQIDATNLQVAAANITGQLTASQINSTGLHVSSANIDGTLSASKINGGTLTVGGSNNTNGTIVVKDENDTQIGRWSKDGISINKGIISSSTIQNGNDIWNSNGITLNSGNLVINNSYNGAENLKLSTNSGDMLNYRIIFGGGTSASNVLISQGNIKLYESDQNGGNISGLINIGGGSITTPAISVGNSNQPSFTAGSSEITAAKFSNNIYAVITNEVMSRLSAAMYHQIKANIINYDTISVPFTSGKCVIKRRDTSGQNGVRMLIIGVNAVGSNDDIYAIRYSDMWDYQLINKTNSNATVTVDVISINYEDVTDKGHWII